MNFPTNLRRFCQSRLPLILAIYVVLQPVLDILTSLGVNAEHPVTAGVLVRTLFMVLTFLYVVFVSKFEGKKWCLAFMGILVTYLALFMLYMLSLGGLSLALDNVKELMKVFFAPFVMVFLYTIYREYGHLISTRVLAISGGIYASVILLAYLTGTSFVSYGNSGYGYKGWFYAANEVSSIIALTGPIVIYYCLKQIPAITRKTWWQAALIVFALVSVAFSANFIGTKIVFGITLLYCGIAFVWSLAQTIRERSRENLIRTVVFLVLTLFIASMYTTSPLAGYLNNIYFEMMDEESELLAVSWSQDLQDASEGTWLREMISNNELVKRLDQILSRRLFNTAPSLQVWLDGGIVAKLLGVGYATGDVYDRVIEFMVEIDPLSILIRQGILGFIVYYLPYLAGIIWAIIRFFRKPARRLASLEYCSYLYSTLMAFAISTIAGHALVSPAVSTYVLIISFRTWVMTRAQDAELPPEDN